MLMLLMIAIPPAFFYKWWRDRTDDNMQAFLWSLSIYALILFILFSEWSPESGAGFCQ